MLTFDKPCQNSELNKQKKKKEEINRVDNKDLQKCEENSSQKCNYINAEEGENKDLQKCEENSLKECDPRCQKEQNNKFESSINKDQQKDIEKICRICYDSDSKEDLYCPCKCSGSIKWVHNSCLNKWILMMS